MIPIVDAAPTANAIFTALANFVLVNMNISLDILFLFVYLLFLYNGFSSISATIYVTATLGQHALGKKKTFF